MSLLKREFHSNDVIDIIVSLYRKQELMHGVLLADDAAAQGGDLDDRDGSSSDSSSSSDSDSEGELLLSAKSDFPDMDSIEVGDCKAL